MEQAFQPGFPACDAGILAGGKVLITLYWEMGSKPVEVDLPDLWRQLGVGRQGGQIVFRSDAPLSRVRPAISSRRSPGRCGASSVTAPGDGSQGRSERASRIFGALGRPFENQGAQPGHGTGAGALTFFADRQLPGGQVLEPEQS